MLSLLIDRLPNLYLELDDYQLDIPLYLYLCEINTPISLAGLSHIVSQDCTN